MGEWFKNSLHQIFTPSFIDRMSHKVYEFRPTNLPIDCIDFSGWFAADTMKATFPLSLSLHGSYILCVYGLCYVCCVIVAPSSIDSIAITVAANKHYLKAFFFVVNVLNSSPYPFIAYFKVLLNFKGTMDIFNSTTNILGDLLWRNLDLFNSHFNKIVMLFRIYFFSEMKIFRNRVFFMACDKVLLSIIRDIFYPQIFCGFFNLSPFFLWWVMGNAQ